MGKTISLYFEDSPTTISFPNSSDEDVPCSKEKEVVEITSNEFCNGIVLLGICYRSQVIQAIYEGLLSMVRFEFKCEDGEGPWNDLDNMTLYNKLNKVSVSSMFAISILYLYSIVTSYFHFQPTTQQQSKDNPSRHRIPHQHSAALFLLLGAP